MTTIDVLYSCQSCGVVDQVVHAEERSAGVHVSTWVEGALADAIRSDHNSRSPFCRSSQMSAVKIPMSGRKYIGGPAIQ